ncbi:arylsulfatase B-like [Tigriopus californicus]|uniref:arylsulfatase B-like n=1 Tax=Tigriopus californicus TaxID=6832 RepID=UPI0027DA4F32|nr:arylsulfatase B-like [Tigriopus californicus]
MSRVSRTGYCLCILTITTWLIQFKLHHLSTPHITLQKPVPSHPHIIFILADDLGWNDVGFHGMNQIPTPNIDALAYSGVILHNYYTLHVCSPSRGALLTGMHPIHLGLQDSLLGSMTPSGLPLAFKLLPEYLKGDLGYATHIMGKWHLGAHRSMYTPIFRGFDSHVGFWHGQEDYFNHTSRAEHKGSRGYDFRRDMNISFSDDGKYVTDIITKESIKIIQNHNSARPLFLLVSHAAVHTPVQAHVSVTEQFSYINCSPAWHNKRQVFAAQLKSLDESVGHIVQVLQQEMMLENSIIVFSTDNGGAGDKYHGAVGSNFPLRGMKSGLFEGGIRGVGAVWSPLIQNQARISSEMMTIYDWLPTLYSAAGGQFTELPKMDGVDLWPAISKQQVSPRKIILHNSSSSKKVYALRVQNYKMAKITHKGNRGFNFWRSVH